MVIGNGVKIEKFDTIKVEKVKKKLKITQDFSMKICKLASKQTS